MFFCIFWFLVWSRGSLSCLFLVSFQERSASQPFRQHRPSVTLSHRFLEVEKIYNVSSPVPSTRLGKHFNDILILPTSVTFNSRCHLIHAGSVFQDDPGCCSKDRLPQTSTATLDLLPCPAGGANQDECQRCKLLNLPYGHAQADQKQGEAFIGDSRSDCITGDSTLTFLLMDLLHAGQQACIFGRKGHSGRAQEVWWKPWCWCILHVFNFLLGGWWSAGKNQTGEGRSEEKKCFVSCFISLSHCLTFCVSPSL